MSEFNKSDFIVPDGFFDYLKINYWAILPRVATAALSRIKDSDVVSLSAQAKEIYAREHMNDGENEKSFSVQNGLAIIPIEGMLTKKPTCMSALMGNTRGYLSYKKDLRQALTDDSVRGIMLDMSSPGGSISGLFDLADYIYEANKKKPIYAYISDIGCSACYLLASQAKAIYCNSNALVGSIGVYTTIEDVSKAYSDLGIKVNLVRSSDKKGIGVEGVKVSEKDISEIQKEIDSFQTLFEAAVLRGRVLNDKQKQKVFDASVFVGQQAVNVGLVDKCISFEKALSIVAEDIKTKKGSKASDLACNFSAESDVEVVLEKETEDVVLDNKTDEILLDQNNNNITATENQNGENELNEDEVIAKYLATLGAKSEDEIKNALYFTRNHKENLVAKAKEKHIAAFGSDNQSIDFTLLDINSLNAVIANYETIVSASFGGGRKSTGNSATSNPANVTDKIGIAKATEELKSTGEYASL